MMSSSEALKDVLKVQQYVTPGFVNETGQWKMEPLLGASEAINQQGERVPLFNVSDRTYLHLGVNTEVNLKSVSVLFPAVKKKRD